MNNIDSKYQLYKLYEQLLREDKTRFVKKAIDAVKSDSEIGAFFDNSEEIQLIDFANSSAVDQYKIDWQEKDGIKLYKMISDAYSDYKNKGGSIKDKKQAIKADPKLLFLNANGLEVKEKKLSVVEEHDDCSNADMVILNSLENEDFIFVMPLTYEACVWIDSFSCGGQGAQWCLGYEKTYEYWNDYTQEKGDIFILAFSKKEYANPSGKNDKLKYMIELPNIEERSFRGDDWTDILQAWKQSDFSNDTIKAHEFKTLFKYDANKMLVTALIATGSDIGWIQDYWEEQFEELMEVGQLGNPYYDPSVFNTTTIKITRSLGYSQIKQSLGWISSISKKDVKYITIIIDGNNTCWEPLSDGNGFKESSEINPAHIINYLISVIPEIEKVEIIEFRNFRTHRIIFNNESISKLPKSILFNKCDIYTVDFSEDFLKNTKCLIHFLKSSYDILYASEVNDANNWMHLLKNYLGFIPSKDIVMWKPKNPNYKDNSDFFDYL